MPLEMPKKLTKCPRTPECTSRLLFEADDGELFKLDTRNHQFIPHVCSTRGPEMPEMTYLGEWKNSRTGRTRFIGPTRLRHSAGVFPKDSPNRRVFGSSDQDSEWKLIRIFQSPLNWSDSPDPEKSRKRR